LFNSLTGLAAAPPDRGETGKLKPKSVGIASSFELEHICPGMSPAAFQLKAFFAPEK
jgi:hypothetical protein